MPTLSNMNSSDNTVKNVQEVSESMSTNTPPETSTSHLPSEDASRSQGRKISLGKVTSLVKSSDESVSSPTVTRGFLNSSAAQSLLRKPSRDEEFSSFWSALWPRLVKLGWTYTEEEKVELVDSESESQSNNTNFVFYAPSGTAGVIGGTSYRGVPQVLEIVEKIPSLSYYLTQMVLMESSSSFNNSQSESENNDDDEVLIMAASMGQQRRQRQDEYLQDQHEFDNWKPLASVPFENWTNCVVKNISHGPIKGVVGKVVKIASGWVTVESIDTDNPIVFSKRAADLRVVEENGVPVAPMEGKLDSEEEKKGVPEEETKGVPEEEKKGVSEGKKATKTVSPSEKKGQISTPEQQNVVTTSKRNVGKPQRYQDHAMLEKKKRKGRGSTSPVPTPSAGASIASPSPEFDEPLDRESEDDFNETDPTKQLLSKLPQSNWLQRRVRVLAGPSKGKTGTTFKVHYGWVHVYIGDDSPRGREEACRRAQDLELLDDISYEEGQDFISGSVTLVRSEEDCDTKPADNEGSSENLLSNFPPETWPGMLVRVKFGGFAGNLARVLRVNNGWIHLSSDLATNYTRIENYDACRRAFELEVVTDDSASFSEDNDETSQTPRHEERLEDETDDSGSDSSVTSMNVSPRQNAFRSALSPGTGRQSLGFNQASNTENPFANKRIMVGSNYQVSASSLPSVSDKNYSDSSEMNHRLDQMPSNCVWSKDLNIDKVEMDSILSHFDVSDADWITSLFLEGKRNGVENIVRYVRSKIIETRVGHLKVYEKPNDSMEVNSISEMQIKRKRSMLSMNHSFHLKAEQARKRKEHLSRSKLSDIILDSYAKANERDISKEFKKTGWVHD